MNRVIQPPSSRCSKIQPPLSRRANTESPPLFAAKKSSTLYSLAKFFDIFDSVRNRPLYRLRGAFGAAF